MAGTGAMKVAVGSGSSRHHPYGDVRLEQVLVVTVRVAADATRVFHPLARLYVNVLAYEPQAAAVPVQRLRGSVSRLHAVHTQTQTQRETCQQGQDKRRYGASTEAAAKHAASLRTSAKRRSPVRCVSSPISSVSDPAPASDATWLSPLGTP